MSQLDVWRINLPFVTNYNRKHVKECPMSRSCADVRMYCAQNMCYCNASVSVNPQGAPAGNPADSDSFLTSHPWGYDIVFRPRGSSDI